MRIKKFEPSTVSAIYIYCLVIIFVSFVFYQAHVNYTHPAYGFEDSELTLAGVSSNHSYPWHFDEIRDSFVATKVFRGDTDILSRPLFFQKTLLYTTLAPIIILSPESIFTSYPAYSTINLIIFLVALCIILFKLTKSHLPGIFAIALVPLIENNSLVTGFWFYTGFSLALTVLALSFSILLILKSKSAKAKLISTSIFLFLTAISQGSVFIIALMFFTIIATSNLIDTYFINNKTYSKYKFSVPLIISCTLVVLNLIISLLFNSDMLKSSKLSTLPVLSEIISQGPYNTEGLGAHIVPVPISEIIPLFIIILGVFGFVYIICNLCTSKTPNKVFKSKGISYILAFTIFSFALHILSLIGTPMIINSNKLVYLVSLFIVILASFGAYFLIKILSNIPLLRSLPASALVLLLLVVFMNSYTSFGEVSKNNYFLHNYHDADKMDVISNIDAHFIEGSNVRVLTDIISSYSIIQLCKSCSTSLVIDLYDMDSLNNHLYSKIKYLECETISKEASSSGFDLVITTVSVECPPENIIYSNNNYQLIAP